MRKTTVTILLWLILASVSAATQSVEQNKKIKDKLIEETSMLQKDLSKLNKTVSKLKADKTQLETQIKKVQAWGISQQSEKFEYYGQLEKYSEAYSKVKTELAEEKEQHKKTIEKYRRVKKVFAVVVGVFVALLYVQIGRFFTLQFAGPYVFLLSFLGPTAAFALGFSAVYLYL